MGGGVGRGRAAGGTEEGGALLKGGVLPILGKVRALVTEVTRIGAGTAKVHRDKQEVVANFIFLGKKGPLTLCSKLRDDSTGVSLEIGNKVGNDF